MAVDCPLTVSMLPSEDFRVFVTTAPVTVASPKTWAPEEVNVALVPPLTCNPHPSDQQHTPERLIATPATASHPLGCSLVEYCCYQRIAASWSPPDCLLRSGRSPTHILCITATREMPSIITCSPAGLITPTTSFATLKLIPLAAAFTVRLLPETDEKVLLSMDCDATSDPVTCSRATAYMFKAVACVALMTFDAPLVHCCRWWLWYPLPLAC